MQRKPVRRLQLRQRVARIRADRLTEAAKNLQQVILDQRYSRALHTIQDAAHPKKVNWNRTLEAIKYLEKAQELNRETVKNALKTMRSTDRSVPRQEQRLEVVVELLKRYITKIAESAQQTLMETEFDLIKILKRRKRELGY